MELCVTGGIACGKTMVGKVLAGIGFTVVEADDVCHALMRPGTPVYKAIVDDFGRAIVGTDGAINRAALGSIVFEDAQRRTSLNALLHPPARAEIERRRRACTGPFAAIVPLIYEVNWAAEWEIIVCVSAPVNLQFDRLRQRGLDDAAARARLAAQWPIEEKMRRADHVLYNSGSLDILRGQINLLLPQYRH